jgi:hypothetical protein
MPRWVYHVRPAAGQLAPHVGDIGGHDRAGPAEVVVPDVGEQLRPGQHPAGVEHQVAQQPELGRGEFDQVTGAADLVAVLVQFDVGEREHRPRGRRPGAAQHGPDPGRQFLQPERLGQVVVAADGQPVHLVRLGVPGGQEDHRYPQAVPAQPGDHLEPVGVGQHHIQHDQVERAVPGQPQRARAVLRRGHLKAQEPQRGGHSLAQERLVINHQQFPLARGQAGRGVRHRLAPLSSRSYDHVNTSIRAEFRVSSV